MRALVLGGCALLLLATCPAFATTYHVAPDSSGDVLNIQAAIDAAVSGDEIVLSDGVFTGDGNWDLNLGTKDLVVTSVNGYEATSVHCGFQSTWIYPSHQGFILEGGQTSATRIENITIERSYGNDDGGSIRCVDASPVIHGLRIRENVRRGGRGGGIFVHSGLPVVEDCVFEASYYSYFAVPGEAIYSEQAFLTVQRCSFTGIHAAGGVVYLDAGMVVDCTFEGCAGPWEDQDASLRAMGGRVSILGCTFRHAFGSGALIAGGLIDGCRFEYNVGDFGAGLEVGGDTTVRNTVFFRNQAGFTGSAIDCWGTLLLDHCTFERNSRDAVIAGGSAVLDVTGCTFVSNGSRTDLPDGPGSSISSSWGSPNITIDHSIIAFGGGAASLAVSCYVAPGALRVTCSDFFRNPGGDWVGCLTGMGTAGGNLSADPLFCDFAGGNFGLMADSPCAPANSGECGLIGALDVSCGPTSLEPHSWGSIKALYR